MFYFHGSAKPVISGASGGPAYPRVDKVPASDLTCDGSTPPSYLNLASALDTNIMLAQCTANGSYYDSAGDTTDTHRKHSRPADVHGPRRHGVAAAPRIGNSGLHRYAVFPLVELCDDLPDSRRHDERHIDLGQRRHGPDAADRQRCAHHGSESSCNDANHSRCRCCSDNRLRSVKSPQTASGRSCLLKHRHIFWDFRRHRLRNRLRLGPAPNWQSLCLRMPDFVFSQLAQYHDGSTGNVQRAVDQASRQTDRPDRRCSSAASNRDF